MTGTPATHPATVDPATVDAVLVVGAGTMGAGIAQCMLEAGAAVTLVDTGTERVAAGVDRVREGLLRRFRTADDPAASAASLLGRLTGSDGLPPTAEVCLAVEAVPEDAGLKATVLRALEAVVPAGAVVASNTSSLSIDALAAALLRPERFIGMHFFNPVPRSELVELVVGSRGAPATTEAARTWVDRLGKQAIEVRDSPGFATSRLGVAIGLEAIRMLEEGVASAEDIDRGMVLGYRFPMGPLRLTDLVGLDVRLGIAEHLAAELGPRFEPPALLRSMVAEGLLGQKTGRGFYRW